MDEVQKFAAKLKDFHFKIYNQFKKIKKEKKKLLMPNEIELTPELEDLARKLYQELVYELIPQHMYDKKYIDTLKKTRGIFMEIFQRIKITKGIQKRLYHYFKVLT